MTATILGDLTGKKARCFDSDSRSTASHAEPVPEPHCKDARHQHRLWRVSTDAVCSNQFMIWTQILNKPYTAWTINLCGTFFWPSPTCIFHQRGLCTSHFSRLSSVSQSVAFHRDGGWLSVWTSTVFVPNSSQLSEDSHVRFFAHYVQQKVRLQSGCHESGDQLGLSSTIHYAKHLKTD